jgi:hypothetical protein
MKFDEETLLRNVDKNHFGVFFLFKAVFVNESEDDYIGSERCDNLSYGVSPVVHGTPYEYQSFNEPFNSDHPMAEYSKKFFDHTQPPQNILDEIDSYPDMQLAKFLKVQDDYRKIPEFPDMSEDMKQWVLEIAEMYGPK